MAEVDKVLRNSGAKLTVTFYIDGTATDADGAVTVTVTDAAGNALATGATATSETATGEYSWVLSPQADLKKLTLDWTGDFSTVTMSVRTYAEVIGQHLFSINEARTFRKDKLADDTKYLTEDIIDIREEITDFFEKYCYVSFVPKYGQVTLDGDNNEVIYLKKAKVSSLLSVTEDDVSLTLSDINVWEDGRLKKESGTWNSGDRNIVVEFEHGYDRPPGMIVRAALVLLQSFMLGSDVVDRKITLTDDTGVYRLSFPDQQRERPTGIPFVDATLNEFVENWGVA